ncbi:hypothetical protein Patl1_24210 [Pistacia atlantica]|uniref:Uncharacterized protein n=1 Tax=Pistacia atlantica TaxID=434234 RepID=A0ACC0ZXW5_9ROSI|nr:hypothetical protein Patl1_24210 [Pistacia atlantica]
MGKTTYKRLKESQSFRQRLVLVTLTNTPVFIEDIRAEETWPGLRLLEKAYDDCVVEISETGHY